MQLLDAARANKKEHFEESIEEVADYCAGGASASRLWPGYVDDPFSVWHDKKLPSISFSNPKSKVKLYVVEGHCWRDRRLGLLPGIPANLLSQPEVAKLGPGSPLFLILPSGVILNTFIETLYVRIANSEFGNSSSPENTLTVIEPRGDFTEGEIPVGAVIYAKLN